MMISSRYADPNWEQLPICALNCIMERLILFDDYVHFGAVCVKWRTAFDEYNNKKKKHGQSSSSIPPFLLIPLHHNHNQEEEEEEEEEKEEVESYYKIKYPSRPSTYNGKQLEPRRRKRRRIAQTTRSLYNVLSQKVCDFEVRLPHNYYCRGSSFGWLITMKPKKKFGYYYKYYVQLFNPFLSNKHNFINLPPLYKILKQEHKQEQDGVYHDHLYDRLFFYLRKAVLSCNPMFNGNFVVMAIVSQVWKLTFYTPENKDWTPIYWEREDWSYFLDVIYFKKTQQFYAVLQTGEVLAIDLITEAEAPGRIIPKVTQIAPPTHLFAAHGLRYLVETSSGELLQAFKKLDCCIGSCSQDNYVTTVKFDVFKLDPAGLAWSQIHDMGDTILFLGDNSSISRTVSNFPGCKPNCIYYTDDVSMEREVGGLYDPQDMGIYNLADGTHQPHYPTTSRKNFPTPIWIEPTLPRSIDFDS
ncbi:hypothetical protein AQUCO_02000222v1 [Aquilegia coerulea]|uniref:Uncharacterized protein n=1 Tax=Aquilegia coerulea TaxID=218851 RepID=A0A2G5DHC2_AQUCA|nr:hypothetical protein AQUCO_02000222v1 [Aquilegia coerulea]